MNFEPPVLFPAFEVEVAQTLLVPVAEISALLATVSKPRPNQSVTVRDLADEFTAEVVYLQEPLAPTHRVTYLELAQAWAAAISAQKLSGSPKDLAVGDAALVLDVACGHVVLERSR